MLDETKQLLMTSLLATHELARSAITCQTQGNYRHNRMLAAGVQLTLSEKPIAFATLSGESMT
jgi:hypothetical protein